jgi:hypothetical protein
MPVVSATLPLLQHTRTAALKRPFVLWLLALLVVLKAAVPLLASAAASLRDVATVEVCTVYGVQTVALEPAAADEMGHHADGHDMAGDGAAPHTPAATLEHREHCALSPALGKLLCATTPVAAVLLHAPQLPRIALPPPPLPPRDASLAWLARHTHAPPALV